MSDSPRDLHTLTFVSRARPDLSDGDIDSMMTRARIQNSKRDITALCILHDKVFLQTMEGPRKELQSLYEKSILQDSRHFDVTLIHQQPIHRRHLKNWPMVFRELQDMSKQLPAAPEKYLGEENCLFALGDDTKRALALVRQVCETVKKDR